MRTKLDQDYEIYIEPVIYQLGKVKPDMVITKKDKIISIIELKAKPWEYPNFLGDMKKLDRFKKDIKIEEGIVLGWIPNSIDWYEQNSNEQMKLKYFLDKDMQLIMAIISRHDSDIIIKEIDEYSNYCNVKNFKIFLGYLNKDKKIEFRMK